MGNLIRRSKQLSHPEFQPSKWYNIPVENINNEVFDVNINQPVLTGFVDAAHANELQKRQSTIG